MTRTVEIRRHAERDPGGVHLNQAGVGMARRVGAGMGPFDLVVTSRIARAIETAVAMGFAVDEELAELGMMGPEVEAELAWGDGIAGLTRSLATGRAAARWAAGLAELLRRIAASVPEGGSVLVISHGGIIECSAIAAVSGVDCDTWGGAVSYCEGVRLTLEGDRFTAAEVLRVA